ncbi:MAG: histidine--tRNA ligase, partial [Spirochaetota bacterium]|nr:histidine--tRNA ligase [Spirochaetota bacterium]
CRPPFRRILLDYYRSKKRKICPRCAKRLKENPLRALDCKEEKCQRIAAQAPAFIDYLCDECRTHFKNVLEFLDEIEIPYFLNSHLVRGLDYYTNTVFEIFKEGEEQRAQSALGGGGRYNGLVKHLGGKDTPAVGGSLGLDRLIELMKQENIKVALPSVPSVFLIQLGDLAKKKALKLYFELQKADISVAEAFSKDSIKSQLKIADKLGAKFSLILGQQEALDKKIIIRNMETGIQEIVPIEKIILEIKKRLKK